MNVDPDLLASRRVLAERMQKAIRTLDAATIVRVLNDPSVERVEFAPGRTYRLLVMGAPTVGVDREVPEATDSPHDAISKLSGMDHRATAEAAGVIELRGTYRGRLPTPGFPHSFRLASGKTAVFADMDVLAWERA